MIKNTIEKNEKFIQMITKLQNEHIHNINIQNKINHFNIDVGKRNDDIYIIVRNCPIDIYKFIPKDIRLEGNAYGIKIIRSNRNLTDLEKEFRKFVIWLLDQKETVIFTS